MKCVILLGLVLSLLAPLFCRAGEPEEGRAAGRLPRLSLEGLMDETLPEEVPGSGLVLPENQACFVCHENYKGEELVQRHAKSKIGCMLCHGESLAHRNDEDNITPPEDMFAADHVDGMCGRCHHDHRVSARQVIERWRERCPGKTNPGEINCTDCHFAHRLASRNVRWDKETGELLLRPKKPLGKPVLGAGAGH